MEHACTTAFPQDSLASGCSRTAACLLPTERGMPKGGALIQLICIGSIEDISQCSWQAVFPLRAKHGDPTAVSGATPLFRRC